MGSSTPSLTASTPPPRWRSITPPATSTLPIGGAHSILLWKPGGQLLTLINNGKGFAGDGGPAKSAQLNTPSALALDPANGTLYIADEGNNRIRALTADGRIQTIARMQAPAGLTMDAAGHLIASESATGRILQITAAGPVDFVPNTGLWTNPRGLVFDLSGALFIADATAHRITRIDRDGTVSLAAGTATRGLNSDSPVAAALASFDSPSALAADLDGTIYVADTGNNRVRALTVASSVIAAPVTQLFTLVNAASRLSGTVAAGELVTLIGTGIETAEIQINSEPAVPLANGVGEVTLALPDTLDSLEIQVLVKGVPQARLTPPLGAAAVGVFANRILNDDGTLNAGDNPAARGSPVRIYGTGEGRSGVPVTATLDGQLLGTSVAAADANTFELTAYLPGGYFPAGAKVLEVTAGASTSQPGVKLYVR